MNIVVFPAAECHIDSHVTFCTKVFIILSMHKTTPWHGGCVSALCAHCEEFCIRRRCLQRPLTYDFYAPLAIYFLTILSTFKNANYFDNESIILWVSSHQLERQYEGLYLYLLQIFGINNDSLTTPLKVKM